MTTMEVAKKYVSLCKEGRNDACLDTLFAEDAMSVEAATLPGGDRTSKGLAAIREKGKAWMDTHTIHKAEVFGPFPNDDRFVYEVTNKPTGKRFAMDEVGLFTVKNDKITREEFFYSMG